MSGVAIEGPVYVDSSALIKIYLPEAGSRSVRLVCFRPHGPVDLGARHNRDRVHSGPIAARAGPRPERCFSSVFHAARGGRSWSPLARLAFAGSSSPCRTVAFSVVRYCSHALSGCTPSCFGHARSGPRRSDIRSRNGGGRCPCGTQTPYAGGLSCARQGILRRIAQVGSHDFAGARPWRVRPRPADLERCGVRVSRGGGSLEAELRVNGIQIIKTTRHETLCVDTVIPKQG